MARAVIRCTYAFDAETVEALDRLMQRWHVSKSEAVRRAIRHADGEPGLVSAGPLRALDHLQQSFALTPGRARRWARQVRAERRASSVRAETRRR